MEMDVERLSLSWPFTLVASEALMAPSLNGAV